jgi:hypothetical protein
MHGKAIIILVLVCTSAPATAAEPFIDGARGNCFLCDVLRRGFSSPSVEDCAPTAPAISEQRSKKTLQEAESEASMAF